MQHDSEQWSKWAARGRPVVPLHAGVEYMTESDDVVPHLVILLRATCEQIEEDDHSAINMRRGRLFLSVIRDPEERRKIFVFCPGSQNMKQLSTALEKYGQMKTRSTKIEMVLDDAVLVTLINIEDSADVEVSLTTRDSTFVFWLNPDFLGEVLVKQIMKVSAGPKENFASRCPRIVLVRPFSYTDAPLLAQARVRLRDVQH